MAMNKILKFCPSNWICGPEFHKKIDYIQNKTNLSWVDFYSKTNSIFMNFCGGCLATAPRSKNLLLWANGIRSYQHHNVALHSQLNSIVLTVMFFLCSTNYKRIISYKKLIKVWAPLVWQSQAYSHTLFLQS